MDMSMMKEMKDMCKMMEEMHKKMSGMMDKMSKEPEHEDMKKMPVKGM